MTRAPHPARWLKSYCSTSAGTHSVLKTLTWIGCTS